jgi:hypothetical protein
MRGFEAQILQPGPLPFALERLHTSLQRRKIDLTNRQRGSKGRPQEQAAANLNRVDPAEVQRNSGVALERVLHGRNNRGSKRCGIDIVLEGGKTDPSWRGRDERASGGGGRQACMQPHTAPFSNGSAVASCTAAHYCGASFCYRNTCFVFDCKSGVA